MCFDFTGAIFKHRILFIINKSKIYQLKLYTVTIQMEIVAQFKIDCRINVDAYCVFTDFVVFQWICMNVIDEENKAFTQMSFMLRLKTYRV